MAHGFAQPPPVAAWRHGEIQQGFEVLFIRADGDGLRVAGHIAAVEEGQAWAVEYEIALDGDWRTRSAQVRNRSAAGPREVALEADGAGHWTVDGERAPELDGYLDVDLEASAFTNALPVHRLELDVGQAADAPAVYVRALDLAVERLEQRYRRLPDEGAGHRYHYESPADGFEAELAYDEAGLVLDYPGIAVRAL